METVWCSGNVGKQVEWKSGHLLDDNTKEREKGGVFSKLIQVVKLTSQTVEIASFERWDIMKIFCDMVGIDVVATVGGFP